MTGNNIIKRVLITGATGFLGSHIAEELVYQGFDVIALKRSTSNLWRCDKFKEHIKWINCDNLIDAEPEIVKSTPEILIHAAWSGVKASERDNWIDQEKNLSFFVSLLETAKKIGIHKIIALGSQAEYGVFEGDINENYHCNPDTAYGVSKLCASILLKAFAMQNKIEWLWIRLFSIFGPREGRDWLIPTTINSLLIKEEIVLTPCEQQYDYLFIKDFVAGIISVVKNSDSNSGIYNLSSGKSVKIRDILSFLEDKIASQQQLLQIGALPYRTKQIMHMQGNSDHFFRVFDFHPTYSLYEGLEETIDYYTTHSNNE